ncbi:putative glycosyltransferase [Bacillus sp. TS-2]|nr:putative glycosyltransferase [Bacillus sp. TS-2]
MDNKKRINSRPFNTLARTIMKKAKKGMNRILTYEQKTNLKNKIPFRLQNKIQILINPNLNSSEKKIERLRRKLLNLGFVEKAYEDLLSIVYSEVNVAKRKMAIWELIQWHANQYTEADAQECLKFIKLYKSANSNHPPVRLRQLAILEAECLQFNGQETQAKNVFINHAINVEPNLLIAKSNFEEQIEEKVHLLNQIFDYYQLENIKINEKTTANVMTFDCISTKYPQSLKKEKEDLKVTVIMPVHNAEGVIKTSIDSVLNQSWSNLEVIIVDDCSTDLTREMILEYQKQDDRIQFIEAETNGGPYVARNLALKQATGDFVTCHDADDWSHSRKIEIQVNHLIDNPKFVGNTTQQARATNDLHFHRRGNAGYYLFNNMSSFMFRREKITQKIGYWDCVRFGADSEMIKRIKTIFGEDSIVELLSGPLSFQRQTGNSLTGNSTFGYHGFFMGARKEYFEAFNYYHEKAPSLYYPFPQVERPFSISEPMKPSRINGIRHFDVIIVSDFRLDGGSTLSNLEEIKAQRQFGLKTGIVQLERYDYSPRKKINPKIRELIDGETVQMIVYGENVTCDVLIVRYPPILQEKQKYVPQIKAKSIHVIINQTPLRDYGKEKIVRFDLKRSHEHLKQYFGGGGIWYPIGPLVRKQLEEFHYEEIRNIDFSPNNWVNIIDLNGWKRQSPRVTGSKPIIGRHSRDHIVKWPATKEQIAKVYPITSEYEVHILGGAEIPTRIIGKRPKNWKVYSFNELDAKTFLETIDVFVYYTHPDWVESFGRVILEAMAVGVPVILPSSYQELFKEGAIYAEPEEVLDKVDELWKNKSVYQCQVEKAYDFLSKHFSYERHFSRLNLKGDRL